MDPAVLRAGILVAGRRVIRKLVAVEEQQKELWGEGAGGIGENFSTRCFVIYFYRYSPMQKKKLADSVLIGN